MSPGWQDDHDLFTLCRTTLFTAVVGDIMDRLGLLQQFLPPQIRPLAPEMLIIGRAMPVLELDCMSDETQSGHNPALAQPFGLMLDALDGLKPDEVYLCTGASPRYALWGELMSARAAYLGAAGVVANGYIRDTRGIVALGFPTFAYGAFAQDQAPRGKVVDYGIPVQIDAVRVSPGDIVFGDGDGICIVPRHAEADVFTLALEKARGEKTVRAAIDRGMSAREAFKTYGIL
jgi:regulator of RNase E activity RraA